MISMIMGYSYSTPQCAGRLQRKDHSRAFNTDDQHTAAFMLCFRLPGQSEVGPHRLDRAKCCHQPSPLCLVCSHTGTNGDHGADHQKTTQFVLKKPPTVEKNTDFTKRKSNSLLSAVNGCLKTTSYQMKTVLIQYSLKCPQSCA